MLYTYAATLIRVVDADTVRLVLDLGFRITLREQPYRLLRINAPELRTNEGKTAKAWLEQYLQNKTLTATTQKTDDFGRWLAEVLADNINVSDALVAAGMAAYQTYK